MQEQLSPFTVRWKPGPSLLLLCFGSLPLGFLFYSTQRQRSLTFQGVKRDEASALALQEEGKLSQCSWDCGDTCFDPNTAAVRTTPGSENLVFQNQVLSSHLQGRSRHRIEQRWGITSTLCQELLDLLEQKPPGLVPKARVLRMGRFMPIPALCPPIKITGGPIPTQ